MAPQSHRRRCHAAATSPCASPYSSPTSSPAPALALSAEQLDACQGRADALLVDTLRAYTQLDGVLDRTRWRCLGGRAGVSAFRERSPAASPSSPAVSLSLMCVGTLSARLDDVLAGMHCASSDAMRAQSAITCPRIARCAVLQAAPDAPDGFFAGVKWAALRALAGCVPDRDVVYYETSGLVRQETDPGARRLAYVAMQSVPPSLVGGLGRAGARMALCYLLEELEADPARVGVYMLGSVAGFGPAYLMASVFGDLALSVTRAADVARAMKLAALMQTASAIGDARPAVDAVGLDRPSFSRLHRLRSGGACCNECGAAPYVFEALSACAGCRRPHICRRCRSRERVLVRDEDQQRTRVRSTAFCTACRAHADSRPLRSPGASARPQKPAARAHRLSSGASDAFLEDGGACFLDRSRALDAALDDELMSSARSLGVFSLKIAQHLHELDQQSSEQRVSALSSLGTDELARLLLSSGKRDKAGGEEGDSGGASDEESDVLESFHAPARGCAFPGDSPMARPRLSRFSTASSTSSSCVGADDALEAHRQSLFSRLKAASDQAELTFHLAHAQSQTARSVWMRTRFQWLDLE